MDCTTSAAPALTVAGVDRPGGRRARRLAGAVTALALLTGAAACSTVDVGPRTTQDRPVADVTSVRLETSGRLVVQRGDEPSLQVTAGEFVLDRLTSEVVDDTLVLGVDRTGTGSLGPVEYRLTVRELAAVDVRGSGEVQGHGVTGADLAVQVSGSGDVDLTELDADGVEILVEGSGDVRLEGRTSHEAVVLDGSGAVVADDLDAEQADVTVRGSGDVEVHVTRDLRVVVEGSGAVTHTGDAEVDADVRGSGEVRGR
ncbi:hypothetical protein N866_18725 [Actinotalea ferrariae CF5-4]|uniref:Putative auto-transporter adhesin head GIN domain-containing protein n=1 Tax=Actinotalea ferrariae CF5-4 TaxID=948458 RepID=A0A021VR67_9CELL|nr:head GIN domain-containing protein [Actinotalea ferrariae]EYR63694.1 hypothetical protein N866_18725 [Actinotalea ferrariae CF5-4]